MAGRLVLLGPPRLLDVAGTPRSFPGKGLVLAAHLLLSRENFTMTRAEAASLLWEGADAAHAALNFRQLASRIRARQVELGFEVLSVGAVDVRLDPRAVPIDVAEFQRLVARSEPARLAEFCHLYGGDLLDGVDLEGQELSGCIEAHRARLRHIFIEEVCSHLERTSVATEPATLRLAAEAALAVDPYNERALRALMLALSRENRAGLARHAYDVFTARLRKDLDVEPDVETVRVAALVAGVKRRPAPDPVPEPERADAADTVVAAEAPWPRLMVVACAPPEPSPLGEVLSALVADVTIDLCAMRRFAPIAPHTAAIVAETLAETDFISTFGLDYVVECRQMAIGGYPTLFVTLYRGKGREILWAERFDLELATIGASHRVIATTVARMVAATVERNELVRLARDMAPGAYANYLMAQHQLKVVDLPRVRRARKYFQAAIAASPSFAAAFSGLARSFHLEWLLLARRDSNLLEVAAGHAERAVRLDPADARGHRELGVARLYGGRFDESLASFASAETAGPSHADVLADHADALVHAGSVSMGAERIERAIELNPLCPDDYWWGAGGAFYFMEDYGRSIAHLRRMSDPQPAYRLLAASYAMAGEPIQAKRCVRKALEEHPDFRIADWLSIVPIRDPARRAHYEDGLRRAGFR